MTALTQDLSIDSKIAHVDEALIAGEAYTIGDEVIRASHALIEEWDDVSGASKGLRWFIERGEDHTTAAAHSSGATLTLARKYGEGGDPGEQTVYVQPTDPGAVGAGKLWVDTTPNDNEVPLIYRRSDADDEWIDLLNNYHSAGQISLTSGVDGADGKTAELHGADGDGAGGTALLQGGTGSGNLGVQIIAAGGDGDGHGLLTVRTAGLPGSAGQTLIHDGDGLVYGDLADLVPAPPEVPASPDAQDIADALLALGLVTQAAP